MVDAGRSGRLGKIMGQEEQAAPPVFRTRKLTALSSDEPVRKFNAADPVAGAGSLER